MLWMTMTFYDENIAFEEKKSGAKSGTCIYLVANIVYICRVHVVSSRTFSLSDLGEFPPTKTFFQREQPVIPSHKRNEYTDVARVPEPF